MKIQITQDEASLIVTSMENFVHLAQGFRTENDAFYIKMEKDAKKIIEKIRSASISSKKS